METSVLVQTAAAPWWKLLTRYHWFVLIVAALGWLFDCLDQQLFNLARRPAMLELLGEKSATPAGIDGISFAPTLRGEQQPARPFLYRESPGYGGQQCVRVGDWKLVRHQGSRETELYNLAVDVGERRNLAVSRPEKRQELQAAWDDWNAQLVAPRWPAKP